MKIRYLVIIVAVLLLPALPASASHVAGHGSYSADYAVGEGKIFADLAFDFFGNVTSFEWPIPSDSAEIKTSPQYSESTNGTERTILKFQGKPFQRVSIKYVTASFLESTRADKLFILDLSDVGFSKISLTVRLPEKAALKYSLDSPRSSVIPKASEVSTDGKRIILHWDENDVLSTKSVLVIYEPGKASGTATIALALSFLVVLFISGWAIVYFMRKARISSEAPHIDTSPSELTRNLLDEEKAIMRLLAASKDWLWQKQLETGTGLSKVRLSRKLRDLEQKGLIEKIPYGNANRIRLKKG